MWVCLLDPASRTGENRRAKIKAYAVLLRFWMWVVWSSPPPSLFLPLSLSFLPSLFLPPLSFSPLSLFPSLPLFLPPLSLFLPPLSLPLSAPPLPVSPPLSLSLSLSLFSLLKHSKLERQTQRPLVLRAFRAETYLLSTFWLVELTEMTDSPSLETESVFFFF